MNAESTSLVRRCRSTLLAPSSPLLKTVTGQCKLLPLVRYLSFQSSEKTNAMTLKKFNTRTSSAEVDTGKFLVASSIGSIVNRDVLRNIGQRLLSSKKPTKSDKNLTLNLGSEPDCKRENLNVCIDYYGLDEKEHELSHHLHPKWSDEEVRAIKVTHSPPHGFRERLAYFFIRVLRTNYDLFTGYKYGKQDEKCYIRRIIFLETIAGVPGIVGAMIRHLNSLRRMERDYGWIHTLLEEAENERMHLMCVMSLVHKPSRAMRTAVVIGQAGFMAFYTLAYIISPKFCHKLVGYIEEEAVKTYTSMIEKFEKGKLPKLEIPATTCMKAYWSMKPEATIKDFVYQLRADESHHREVNHYLADMKSTDVNPFHPGY